MAALLLWCSLRYCLFQLWAPVSSILHTYPAAMYVACMLHHKRHEESQFETAAAVHAHIFTAGGGFANAQKTDCGWLLELGWYPQCVLLLSGIASNVAKRCQCFKLSLPWTCTFDHWSDPCCTPVPLYRCKRQLLPVG